MPEQKYEPVIKNLELLHQGKVRDTHKAKDPDEMLVYATNRISTHNVVHKSQIPRKGEVLTALTVFWLTLLKEEFEVNTHLLAYGNKIYEHLLGNFSSYLANLHLQAIVVKRLEMIPIEFIYRKYNSGSLYKDFYSKGLPNPYGIDLPEGMPLMYKFLVPVFTPTDKSETDEPQNSKEVARRYPHATKLGELIFQVGRARLNNAGQEAIDAKFELGYDKNRCLCVGDEVLTPDCTRITLLDQIKEGQDPPWLDKQIVRDYVESVWGGKKGPPLDLPAEITEKTTNAYLDVFGKITGKSLDEFQATVMG